MVQQLLKVLFRGLHIVLGQGFISQANFFSHARPSSHTTVCIPLPMDSALARRHGLSLKQLRDAPTTPPRLGDTASAVMVERCDRARARAAAPACSGVDTASR